MKRPGSLDKLSQLQRLILVVLLESRYASLRRREFRSLVKRLYWGKTHAQAQGLSVAVSLSRAITRLEERGLIERFAPGGWQLTCPDTDFVRNGYMFALLAWRRNALRYAQVGLRGPLPSQPPALSAQAPQRKGVEVELKL